MTADTPVALWRRTHTAYGIGVAPADEITFPLDPRHAIIILALDGGEIVWDLHECHAADFNRRVGSVAYEWIYHHPDQDPMKGLALPPPRPPIKISGPLESRKAR